MIALPSILAAFDKPQAKPVSGEGEARESAENAANDGFAALIAQLLEILPMASGQEREAADSEAGSPASGKILPVAGHELAAAAEGQATGEALPSASPLPVSAALMSSSATILSFQQAQTSLSTKQGEPLAQGASDADLPQALAKESVAAQPAPRADQIRMTVAVASAPIVALSAAAPQQAPAPVEKQLSAAIGSLPNSGPEPVAPSSQLRVAGREDGALRSDAPVAAALAAEPKQSGREPQAAAAVVSERAQAAQSVRPASLEKDASSGERSGQPSAAENPAAAARALASAEGTKPLAMPVVAALEIAAANRNEGVRTVAAAPANAMTSVENIERLVERLSVAREFDMTKPASIAVTHREFGALTVTFDTARNGLDVEIAAKDSDMQRALALAVAADRPTSRAGEPLQQSFQQASQAPSAGSERGAGSTGQGANSSGAGPEGNRSNNQRDRNLASSPQDPRHPAAPSPGDDALYA